jgi:nicotinamidase-related amidase
MKKDHRRVLSVWSIFAFCLSLALFAQPVLGQDIIAQWKDIKVPPAPELQQVVVEPQVTALLLLDFNKQTCNAERRPRCIASIPKVKELLTAARAKKMPVVYSLSAGAVPGDIAADLAPLSGDPIVTSGPDKFLGTELERILEWRGVTTVIVTGTAAHGAVLYTASAAALKGFKVIVPVDAMSAENPYAEQYVAWNMVNAPRISLQTTLTRSDLVK